MKEKGINIDSQTEDFFYDNIKLSEIPSKIEQIINSEDIHKISVLNRLIEKFEEKNKDLDSKKKTSKSKDEILSKFNLLKDDIRFFKKKAYKKIDDFKKENLKKKLKIIEGLKSLVDYNININNAYNKFKKLKEEWYSIGPVPKKNQQNIWENYKHHSVKFYDYLHLNRNLRDMDFKHNYDEKIKLIKKAESIAESEKYNIHFVVRELNYLHKLWKNELGPVEKSQNESLWKRFQEVSKKIHAKKNLFTKKRLDIEKENLKKKNNLIKKLEEKNNMIPIEHKDWIVHVKLIDKIKEEFQQIGKVPKSYNKEIWSKYRDALKKINLEKNRFYKKRKIEVKKIIDEKKKMIDNVREILKNGDFSINEKNVKEIQLKWKNIGPLPKKISSDLWNEFNELCNSFFKNLREKKQKISEEDSKIIEIKNLFFKNFPESKIPKKTNEIQKYFFDKIDDLIQSINSPSVKIKSKIIEETCGFFENKWNEISNKSESVDISKFETRIYILKNSKTKLNEEYQFNSKKIKELTVNLNQIQNNLEYVTDSSSKKSILESINSEVKEIILQIDSFKNKIKIIKNYL
tara:strand:+ start:61340 stop:63061 length:1722 start_codon:yes stop_codon:yes gene_type:complete